MPGGKAIVSEISLDAARLENVKHLDGGAIRGACPICRKAGSDKSGDHLLIQPDGKFGCAKYPGDAAHRREIFALVGIKSAPTPANNGSGKRIVATYDYTDATGKLLFQVVRYDPKDFRQRRPDATAPDGWTWKTSGIEKVLFRLPEIIHAVAGGKFIFLTEGERDTLAMVQCGFDATCNPGGAGKWLDGYTETLRGADVCIVADKDAPGRAHAQLVAGKLHGVAKSIRVLELPDPNGRPIKDAADFFAAGGTAENIFELVDTAPIWTPAAPDSNYSGIAREYLGAEVEEPADDLPPIINADDFISEPIEPPAELIEGILHKGSKLAFGGSSKSFKTWSLLDVAISVAAGKEWLGRATAQGKVLFVNFEIQKYAWQGRLLSVKKAKGVAGKIGLLEVWNLRGHAAGFKRLIPKIIARCRAENFALIILDPIYKLYGNTDENSAGNVALLLNELERLATETGAAIAFGAHFAKGNAAGKEAIDRISGSGVFARDPDSLLIFTKHETDDAFTVEPILRNFAPVAPFAVRWQFPLMQPADDLDPARLKQIGGRPAKHRPDDLLAVLPADGLTAGEWLQCSAKSESTFHRLRRELEKAGKIHFESLTSKWKPILTK
jgi:hypothetical protein